MAAPAFTLICGPDDFLVAERARRRWAELSAGLDPQMGLEIIDGQAIKVEEAVDAVDRFIGATQTLSLFGDEKAVWLRNISFLGDNRVGKANGTQEAVENLVAALGQIDPANTRVLLSASPIDRRKKTYKTLQSVGEVDFIDVDRDGEGLVRLAQNAAQEAGATLSDAGARALVERVHAHTRLVLEEARKLATAAGPDGAEIGPELVNDLVPPFGEGDFFETTEAFFALDLAWTLAALRRHFFAGYDARPVLSGLQNRTRLLIQLKALQELGAVRGRVSKGGLETAKGQFGASWGPAAGTKSNFNVFAQNPFYLGRLARPLDKLKMRDLLAFQNHFLAAFTGLLDRPQAQEEVMREAVLKCLAVAR